MTILGIFLINQIRTGGDRRYLELMETLAQRGNSVFILMNSYLEYNANFIKKIEIPVKYIRHRFPPASYLFKKSVKNHLKEISECIKGFSSIDFIHIHGDIYLKTAIYLKKKIGKPFFYASRNNDIDRSKIVRKEGKLNLKEYVFSLIKDVIERNREKQIAKYADIVTFQYPKDRDSFLRRTKSNINKTIIIPGNIGLPRCTPEYKNRNKSESLKNILCVGASSITKGFLNLLRTMECLKKRGFGYIHFTLLGRFSDQKLINKINSSIAADMITLAGFADPFPYLSNHDLLLYPVLFDAYPDAVLEALHTGCPVIASNTGGLPDMLHFPELLFENCNIEQITDKIIKCVNDNTFYKQIRELCSQRVSIHHFDWEGAFEKTMKDYLNNNHA